MTTYETVKIDGVTYEVLSSKTPEDCERENLPAVAAYMRSEGQAKQLYVKRPNGHRLYLILQDVNGVYSPGTAI